MTFEADQIVDRRRLRRKLSFWRVVAVLVAIVAIVLAIGWSEGRDSIPQLAEAQIARVSIDGFITDSRARTEMFEKIGKSDTVKAVIVSINSTGGATTGGEALYESIRKLADRKPTVATIGTVGASAAYMAAIATDHIVARRTSITGSIGVLMQTPEVSELLKTLGIRIEEIKSAPLKAEPSPFEPLSPEGRAVLSGVIQDTYSWFVDIVAERRKLARADAITLSDGRIYTGQQALAVDLIDEIGSEDEAIAWLAKERGIDAKLPIKDWSPRKPRSAFWPLSNAALLWVAEKLGVSPAILGPGALDEILPESLKLDGLVSVWQGSGNGGDSPARGAEE